MEEGKIATAGHSLRDWKKSIHVYKNATLSNTLLAWAGWSISALGEPASFTSAIERREYGRR
jgi:hypothetical protein